MKALMGTAAVVVIATCGYFVYGDIKTKEAIASAEDATEQRSKYVKCLSSLRSANDILERKNSWEGKTYEERLAALESIVSETQGEAVGRMTVLLFERSWKECGPI